MYAVFFKEKQKWNLLKNRLRSDFVQITDKFMSGQKTYSMFYYKRRPFNIAQIYMVSQKENVTTFSRITWTISVPITINFGHSQ